jgi:uncharacterized protein
MRLRLSQPLPLFLGLGLLAALAAFSFRDIGLTGPGLALAGGLAGAALWKAAFGFTASWRDLVLEGRTQGLRIQILMFAVTGLVALPLIANDVVRGALAPVGVAVVLGAFLFGIGMQIAGTCASGSMFGAGGGNLRAMVIILGFVIGVGGAVASYEHWSLWPILPTVSLTHSFGAAGAVIAHLALCGVVLLAAIAYERSRRGKVAGFLDDAEQARTSGRWPLLWGAAGLGLAALLILVISGRPWALISAYALWSSKLMASFGADVSFWEHWAANPTALDKSIFADAASVTDLGAILGALVAAALSGGFALRGGLPLRQLALPLIGGIIMGFGARLSVGCNIGAFFSGIMSGSLHGWVWGVSALAGSWLAIAVMTRRAKATSSDVSAGVKPAATISATPASA